MKFLYSLVLIVLLTTVASAQIPGYPNGCARCGVYGYVDTPAAPDTSIPTVTGEWVIAGWGFECESGDAVDRVDLWSSDDDGYFKPVPYWLTRLEPGIERPDVAAAFVSHCPRVSYRSGYGVYIQAGAVPAGTRVIIINAWRGPYYSQQRRIVVVKQ